MGPSCPLCLRRVQVSGLRVTYNPALDLRAGTRLLAVEVFDRAAGRWAPLDRLRLYRFASDRHVCTAMEPYATLSEAKYTGEAPKRFAYPSPHACLPCIDLQGPAQCPAFPLVLPLFPFCAAQSSCFK